MTQVDEAVATFVEGDYNCAQSIVMTYGPERGLDRSLALRAAAAFGGGIARTGSVCGAISGAIMVIGLEAGKLYGDDPEMRTKAYELAVDFIERFATDHGTTLCCDLTGHDVSTPEAREEAVAAGAFERCSDFVRTAAQLLEEFLTLSVGR
jgi:C_GCAxxG_C_C family probable redox protein